MCLEAERRFMLNNFPIFICTMCMVEIHRTVVKSESGYVSIRVSSSKPSSGDIHVEMQTLVSPRCLGTWHAEDVCRCVEGAAEVPRVYRPSSSVATIRCVENVWFHRVESKLERFRVTRSNF